MTKVEQMTTEELNDIKAAVTDELNAAFEGINGPNISADNVLIKTDMSEILLKLKLYKCDGNWTIVPH